LRSEHPGAASADEDDTNVVKTIATANRVQGTARMSSRPRRPKRATRRRERARWTTLSTTTTSPVRSRAAKRTIQVRRRTRSRRLRRRRFECYASSRVASECPGRPRLRRVRNPPPRRERKERESPVRRARAVDADLSASVNRFRSCRRVLVGSVDVSAR
jgi:hypothetical protein